MKISVVVPAFNEEKLLARSLAAMRAACHAFEARGWSWELVVCDNNSSDRTAELARAAGAKVVFEPVNQISRARNKGAAAASGDWLIFVDADSIPGERLFEAVARRIEAKRFAGGGCLIRLDESTLASGLAVQGWNLLSRCTRWAAGSFIFCQASVFRDLGGFSERMFASEEIEFSGRLKRLARKHGLRVTIISEERLTTSARKIRLYGAGAHLRFFFKVLFSPRRTVANRDQCHLWYDGRR